MNFEPVSPPTPSVDPSVPSWLDAHLSSQLTRLAALTDAVLDQIFATAEEGILPSGSSIEFATELAFVLKTQIAELRRRADMENGNRP